MEKYTKVTSYSNLELLLGFQVSVGVSISCSLSTRKIHREHVIAIESEQEYEPKRSPQHALNYPQSRRSRQNLTEEEKEERRLCRVLANRESARQTIRRRQAMYEELTRKAADLASENENLKKKKELAAKEYDSLKNANAGLRLQIAKREKTKAEETDGASRSKPVEISATSTGPGLAPNPTSLFNQPPITPFFWPPIVQPFNSFLLQCSTQNILPSPTAVESDSVNRQQNSNPGNPVYVLPFPYLIPFHPQNTPILPWPTTLDKHSENFGDHQAAATAQEGKTDVGTSRQSDTPRQHNIPDINTLSCTSGHVGDNSEKTSQESITCSSEKLADAIAATEARKRRKELLHLKGHHSDQPDSHH